MGFYLSMFFLNIIVGCIVIYTNMVKKDRRKKLYLFLTFIQFTLIAGLRSSEVGWDTANYLSYYEISAHGKDLLTILSTVTWVEPGYMTMCYFVHMMGGNAQISLLVAGAVVYGLILSFINRYAISPVMGVISLFCFPVFYDSLNMLRNAIVCAIFAYSLKYIEDRKLIKYLICTLIAISFHNIAYIMIPLYFVSKMNWRNWMNVVNVIAGVVILYVWVLPLFEIVFRFIRKDTYAQYLTGESYWLGTSAGGWRTAIFYIVVTGTGYIIYLLKTKNRSCSAFESMQSEHSRDLLVGYTLILPAAAIMYTTGAMFIRIMIMMMPVAGVFISNEISRLELRGNRKIISSGYFMLLLAFQIFTLYSNAEHYVPYIPFWET